MIRKSMLKKNSSFFLLAAMLFSLSSAPVYAGCGEEVRAEYQRALQEEDLRKRADILLPLTGSTAVCENASIYNQLGYSFFQLGDIKEADRWFGKAAGLTSATDEARIEAFLWRSMAAEKLQDVWRAVEYVESALQIKDDEKLQKRLKDLQKLEEKTTMPADKIKRALNSKGFIPALPVNFAYNSDKLTQGGIKQIEQLGTAIGSGGKGYRYRLIGHTDSRGSDAYNMDLSLRRAKTVKNYLVKHFGIAKENLAAEGRGEKQPRRPEKDEDDMRINRRVEIIVEAKR